MDLVESARQYEYEIRDLVWLLNSDREECSWKQQAYNYAKKIIIKFICQGKLDDTSMASLLKLPETTSVACNALGWLYLCHWRDFYYQDKSFSSVYGEIMQTLLDLFHQNGFSSERRQAIMVCLLSVLDYESEDTIFKVGEKYKVDLAMDCNPSSQGAFLRVFNEGWGRGVLTLAEFPGLLEDLMTLLLYGKDHEVRRSAAESILHLSRGRRISLRVAVFPNALQMLFDLFISVDDLGRIAGKILSCLSILPENRIKFSKIQGIWEGLGSILVKLEGAWQVPGDERRKLKKQASVAATIFGYLGLEKEFRDTIASLPGVREGLIFLQLTEIAGDRNYRGVESPHEDWHLEFYCSTRGLTVLYSNPAEQRLTRLPPFEEVLERIATDEGLQSNIYAMASAFPDICYFSIYWTRFLAYTQMGSYEDSLSNLNLAHRHLNLIPRRGLGDITCQGSSLWDTRFIDTWEVTWFLRRCRAFLQAMQEDYAGALSRENPLEFVETGVLKWLSGDLQAALEDLNAAVVNCPHIESIEYSTLFKHRGYVKYLMGDKIGARLDAEYAKKLELKERGFRV